MVDFKDFKGDLSAIAFAMVQAGAFTKCRLEDPDGKVSREL